MPETYPASPGAQRQPGRAELLPQVLKQLSVKWSLHQQEILPQELKVLWYACINQDIWLLKLVYDRHYTSCKNVAISLLSTGGFVWGICFPTTQEFILKIPCSVGFP